MTSFMSKKERIAQMGERQVPWLDWAVELQALAQAGLYYTENPFDQERYTRIREIAAEMLAFQSELPLEKVKNIFCCETGYQTPKLDTRAAIFQEERILLVRELDGRWSLPGGWVDVNCSVGENVVKEVKEEAGLDVTADLVIAVQDRERHNLPVYAYKVCKVFVLCSLLGGHFAENSETTASGWFSLDALPELALEKNNREQIELCFRAHRAESWKTVLE